MRIIIVGNSAAGTGALEAFRKHDRESKVTIISDENYPLYSRCLLSYFLSGSIDEKRLLFRTEDFHQQFGADVILGKRVESVDIPRQELVCDDGNKYEFDKLLIATGGSAKTPKNIPESVKGIFTLRTVKDAIAIKDIIPSAENAVVLGGGLIGMKAAFALNKCGLKVTVVVRSSHVLSQMIDFEAAQIVQKKLGEVGIKVLSGSDVSEVESKDGKLTTVRIESQGKLSGGDTQQHDKWVPCELLIAAKGVEPNTSLVKGTEVTISQGIVTDAKMQTNIENIYAAGDVAETYGIATEERTVNALWTSAIRQGKIAGFNLAGQYREYDGSIGMNSINFEGVDLISFGIVRLKEDTGYEVMVNNRPEVNIYRKIVLKDNRIKGMILINQIDSAGILLSLLGRKVDVSDLKHHLLSNHFNYGHVLGFGGQEEFRRIWGRKD
jgi:nitrite reductase (NADH) large subunit